MKTASLIILETGAQASGVRHEAGVSFRCMACHAVKPVQTSGGTGYARPCNSDGLLCYACADLAQIADLKDRSRPFSGYVSSDGCTITTWTGGTLMRVTRSRPCQLTRASYTHDRKSFASFHAVDVHGGHWHGRGSPGICINLRPCAA